MNSNYVENAERDFSSFTLFSSDMRIPVADRGTGIEEFITWMKENGAEIGSIEIAQFPGYDYGIKAEKNFAQGDLLIAVPRKVMLTTEIVGESLLGVFMISTLVPGWTVVTESVGYVTWEIKILDLKGYKSKLFAFET
jgi:hypothetical protein